MTAEIDEVHIAQNPVGHPSLKTALWLGPEISDEIHRKIQNSSEIDPVKIAEIKQKIQNGEIGITQEGDALKESAKRIAEKMHDFENSLRKSSSGAK